jgi:tetratricopeptide (TPR) repeat protein
MLSFESALTAHRSGQLDQAEQAYREIIATQPRHADALHLLGLLVEQRGDAHEAERLIRAAVGVREDAVYLANLANLLADTGRAHEAETMLKRAIDLSPSYALAHYNLGTLLTDLGRTDDAEAALERAVSCDPGLRAAWTNLGDLRQRAGRNDDAIDAYRTARNLDPANAFVQRNLGVALLRARRPEAALEALREAVALDPSYVDAYSNLSAALAKLLRAGEAEAACRRALELDRAHREARRNLAHVLWLTNRAEAVEALYREIIATEEETATERFSFGLTLLALGRYEEGWPLAEARYDPRNEPRLAQPPAVDFPQWNNEALTGKSILILHEQGFGDSVQFVRYIALLKSQGARHITFVCPAPLVPLIETAEGIDEIVAPGGPFETHDYWAFLMSLPLHAGTRIDTIPASLPYLRALPARVQHWRERMPAAPAALKVGIVWKGNAGHLRDSTRSLPGLSTLAPLAAIPGVALISLQKGQGEDEARHPPDGMTLTHIGSGIRDFADTAAILAQLDLLIAVDTAAVHVAGALGVPCWVMLPYGSVADWRWMLEREDSPWYPGVARLFRQRAYGDWEEVVGRVAQALKSRVP